MKETIAHHQPRQAPPQRRSAWRLVLLMLLMLAATTAFAIQKSHPERSAGTSAWLRGGGGRRLASVKLTPGFRFDGSTSDLAQQFYRRHHAGATTEPMLATHEALPLPIQKRLENLDLRFEKLPPLLQRALVWDSGFALDPSLDAKFVQIYTVGGVSMAEIAISQTNFRKTGCTTSNCSDPNGMASYRSKNCTGDQMLPATLCASESVTPMYTHTSMWATGGTDDMIPGLSMLRHSWNDPVNETDYIVFALHTVSNEMEPSWDNCPSTNEYSSLIIPCDAYTASRAVEKNWTLPAYGKIVTPWLSEYKRAQQRHKVLIFALVPLCVLGVMILAMVALVIYYGNRKSAVATGLPKNPCAGFKCGCTGRRCRKGSGGPQTKDRLQTGGSSLQHALITPPQPPSSSCELAGKSRDPENGNYNRHRDIHHPQGLRPRRGSSSTSLSSDTENMAVSDRMTHVLLNDLHLYNKRVALEKIQFQRMISKGGFGEVWICDLYGQRVAVKRLLQTHRAILEDVEAFTDEIQIMAALHHPNIPKFIGVAWTTLSKLCMVTEFLDGGDLQSFLKRRGFELTWPQEKKYISLGIARALQYLHSRAPVLIHRDIKSRNILIRETPNLTAKVTDFGVTRSVQRECMTLGVGTPFWTAPEVLDGTTYTEKSDIYSFGVVLSELDTCQSPYHDVLYGCDDSGAHYLQLQPFHILKKVLTGEIQPQFSVNCPVEVRALAAKCLMLDPKARPTAREVVKALEQMQWGESYA